VHYIHINFIHLIIIISIHSFSHPDRSVGTMDESSLHSMTFACCQLKLRLILTSSKTIDAWALDLFTKCRYGLNVVTVHLDVSLLLIYLIFDLTYRSPSSKRVEILTVGSRFQALRFPIQVSLKLGFFSSYFWIPSISTYGGIIFAVHNANGLFRLSLGGK